MTERPNIILIMTDQQRYDTIAALGYPHVETPNLDRLAREGTSFSNCHITAASCVPCRASLFKGYYPHTTGVVANGQPWQRTWVEKLNTSGYHCVNIGKMHTIPYESDSGFHERYVVENKDRYMEGRYYFDEWDKALAANGLVKQQRELYRLRDDYKERLGAFEWELPAHLQSDNFVGNLAKWWVDTYPPTEPLFLQVGFPGPHPPYDPTPEMAERYMARDDIPLPNPTEDELDRLPGPFKEKRQHDVEVDHDSVAWSLDPTPEQMKRLWAHYLANVTMIDEKIGALLTSLKNRGYLENAVVMFTSDHGDCLGDHGLIQKWSMYEEIVRVPLIVWSPGRFAEGRTVDDLCQLFDIGPTILELAECEVPASFEAKSLMGALLPDGEFVPRDHVFCEQGGDVNLTGASFITMVRSSRYKLVHFRGLDEGQLFDLEEDPREVNSLWDSADHAPIKAEMLDVLREWLIESNFHTRGWAAEFR
ncbi:sulfatase-like hydrolase/transferase [Acuticoccus sp. MNP-M23]|uniref:sulfatase family protein n=1 Tax=Acuticoccus sp. MNP-M23 TaxID=3072793 RepID=UPI002815DDAA|nr:sulfatase-like hydrolase/transferase [Acuticoccus sp. MNP-M23]WMS43536.1 sulfatase-like hydrolase/transferase [Acuticoccus sp. MNP-M23]